MVDLAMLVQSSLFAGFVLSVLLGVIVMGSIYFNPEIWLSDYPADVRSKYGPGSERSKRQRVVVAAVFFAVLFGFLALPISQLFKASAGQPGFGAIFLSTWIVLMFFNLFDLVVLDWFIMLRMRPKFAILPGTEGMAGYDDFSLHVRGFFTGIVFSTIASLVIAGIVMLGAAVF